MRIHNAASSSVPESVCQRATAPTLAPVDASPRSGPKFYTPTSPQPLMIYPPALKHTHSLGSRP